LSKPSFYRLFSICSHRVSPHPHLWLFLCFIFLNGCDDYSPDHLTFNKLEQIQHEGTLTVLTRRSPTTYFEGAEGIAGLEYDLVNLFARRLQVKVNYVFPEKFDDLLQLISEGKADIAAAGLTITEQRLTQMRFAPFYQQITEQIVYRQKNKKPHSIEDLKDGILEVVKGSTHIDALMALKPQHPDLDWNVNDEFDSDGLLYLVNEGLIDYTVADSHQAKTIKRFYPQLNTAFDITKPRQLAWALPISDDNSLYNEVKRFFQEIKKDQTLARLLEKYYGNNGNLGYVGNCRFRQHVKERLPEFLPYFQKAAEKYKLDWRLLAAIGYQESHWLPDATSPTGVKGLMMLTQGTSKQLGIDDREDPQQSIEGGALYFKQRLKKIPRRISEPDRTWLALASYNVGFGHLEDARILTQKRGKNPDQWMDVRESLPLLTRKKWYQQTKHGYARGKEPVRYVENIRSYYDLLVWLTEENRIEQHVMAIKPLPRENRALNFEPPVL
jgi:membrane-bound lytic murein transglycosylase F